MITVFWHDTVWFGSNVQPLTSDIESRDGGTVPPEHRT